MLNHVVVNHQCDKQTDGQTHRNSRREIWPSDSTQMRRAFKRRMSHKRLTRMQFFDDARWQKQ